MTAPVIQANYEQLEQVAARFGRATETQHRLIRTIRERADALTRGSWEGEGVSAFARELDDEVMPAMQRLAEALREAQRVTGEMSVVIRTAEEEAARLFRHSEYSHSDDASSDQSSPELPQMEIIGPSVGMKSFLENPSAAGLYDFIQSTDPNSPVQIVRLANGEYLIALRGTNSNFEGTNSWYSNLFSGMGNNSPYTQRIRQAMQEVGIPEGATIHLAGHSQGGHAAQILGDQLASEGTYEVGSITSFGAYYCVEDMDPALQAKTTAYLAPNDPLRRIDRFNDFTGIDPRNPLTLQPMTPVFNVNEVLAELGERDEIIIEKGDTNGTLNPFKAWDAAHHSYGESEILKNTSLPFTLAGAQPIVISQYDRGAEPAVSKIIREGSKEVVKGAAFSTVPSWMRLR
ncbi:MAG: WXG100 family type VII secretion target [Caldilineaceae bacterium]|nr:WXG100 family type VII secretion target [Caldilineaceae bacterium]